MQFIGTRRGEKVSAAEAIYNGLSLGGGVYVPLEFPVIEKAARAEMENMSYAERAKYILSLYFGEFGEDVLKEICEKALSNFDTKDEVPLVKIDEEWYILELFHGRSCSEKDLSVNFFAPLLKEAKKVLKKQEKTLILAVTSGNTGVSLFENFKDDEDTYVVAFYPEEVPSKMQKFNLCASSGKKVYAAGVSDTFDVCQHLIYRMLNSEKVAGELERRKVHAVWGNSVNIARIIPSIVWYFSAYADMTSSGQIEDGEEVDFSVASGNLNAALAGYYAKKMGLPIRKIFVPFNRNKAAYDFFTKGALNTEKSFRRDMERGLDICVPLNIERLLFEASERNYKSVEERMNALDETGVLTLTEKEGRALSDTLYAEFASEDDVLDAMYGLFDDYGYPVDMETGVAAAVVNKYKEETEEEGKKADDTPIVIAATINPYKFPQDVLYGISGNDVKDSYKGVKRLNLLTAMKPPKPITELRYFPVRFKDVFPSEGKKLSAAVFSLLDGNFIPEEEEKKR